MFQKVLNGNILWNRYDLLYQFHVREQSILPVILLYALLCLVRKGNLPVHGRSKTQNEFRLNKEDL